MARLPRIDIPDVPQHLVVRGNNRCDMFRDDADRIVFLKLLDDGLAACACDLHAYVLMSNHVHLLATGHIEGELSSLMQRVGSKFARLMNLRWNRTGTLFEGRFRSSLIESEAYLLACMRYIELNPVRAAMVESPADYPWSSYRQNASGQPAHPLAPHDLYRALGRDAATRGNIYRDFVHQGVDAPELARIRTAARKCRALGGEEFCASVRRQLTREVEPRPPGRPENGDRLEITPDP